MTRVYRIMNLAVLTGDIVSSTKMPATEYQLVINRLQRLIDQADEHFSASGQIFRGDAFQLHYTDIAQALKSTLLIKLGLYITEQVPSPVQCTLSLAYGKGLVKNESPNTSSGPVYITSGRELENTASGDLSVHISNFDAQNELTLLTQFLNHLLNRLTKTQAELLYQYVMSDFAEHKKLAELTGTTRQNISNRLANIGATLVENYCQLINQYVATIKGNI